MKQSAEIGKYYYYFPQAVAFVGYGTNIMPAAWHTPLSAEPPLYGVLISPKRYTYELLMEQNGFTVNFLDNRHAKISAQSGSTSGRDINKMTDFDIAFSRGTNVDGPILKCSYAAFECKHERVHQYGDHYLFVGRIVLLHYREDIFQEDQLLDVNKVTPMLYFGKDRYITIDPASLAVHKRTR